MVYNGNNVKVGPGTLYAAPLGTAEPVSVTGAWPANWVELGYTDQGSEFSLKPTVNPLEVEEEYWPIRNVITMYEGSLTFALAESTRQNVAAALNAGVGSSLVAATQGVNPDGSIWQEMPAIGSETRIMLGWDALTQAGVTGTDPFGRLIARQCLQTGEIKRSARKGANKSVWACTFSLEKPAGVQPFRFIMPAALAS